MKRPALRKMSLKSLLFIKRLLLKLIKLLSLRKPRLLWKIHLPISARTTIRCSA